MARLPRAALIAGGATLLVVAIVGGLHTRPGLRLMVKAGLACPVFLVTPAMAADLRAQGIDVLFAPEHVGGHAEALRASRLVPGLLVGHGDGLAGGDGADEGHARPHLLRLADAARDAGAAGEKPLLL